MAEGRRDLPTLLAEGLVVGAGVWQLWFTLAVRLGLSFTVLLWTLPVPALIAALILRTRPGELDGGSSVAQLPKPIALTFVLTAIAAVGWHWEWVPWPLVWLALVFHGLLLWAGTGAAPTLERGSSTLHTGLLGVSALLGALATLWIHRPEGDDGYYLAQVLYTTVHADLPLLSFDVLHGDPSLPIQQVAHRAQGFETLISVLVALSGQLAQDVYYLYVPAVFAAGGVLAVWVLARDLFGVRAASAAALALVILLLLWGGHHYSYGNYGFARMYQGKAVAVTVMLPLTVWMGLRFVARPDPRSWTLLMLAQCGAAMATSTALVVAPLAAALAVLPGVTLDRRGARLAGAGLASALPVVGMLLLVKLEITEAAQMEAAGALRGLAEALGKTGFTPLAIVAWAGLPVAARLANSPGADWLSRWMGVTTLLLLNGAVAGMVAERAGELYSWRLYWAVPFPAVMALALGVLADKALAADRRWIGALALAVAAIGLTWTPSWSSENGANLRFAQWKLPKRERMLADAILEVTDSDDQVLVPGAVAVRLTPWAERPTLLAVRRGYLHHLERAMGEEEVDMRLRLFGWSNDGEELHASPTMLDELDARCVTVVVHMKKSHQERPQLEDELRERGFAEIYDMASGLPRIHGKYRLWHRPDCTGGRL